MRLGTALALLSAVMCPLLLESTTTCSPAHRHDHVEGKCPVSLNSTRDSTGYFRVQVRVWIKADDFCNSPKIEIHNSLGHKVHLWPTQKRSSKMCGIKRRRDAQQVRCKAIRQREGNNTAALWELVHEFQVKARSTFYVSYIKNSTPCKVDHLVREPIPEFELSVNLSSKSVTITLKPGQRVYARWCYKSQGKCDGSNSTNITIDSQVSPVAVLPLPFLLPCICIEVYYTYPDAKRSRKCPFKNKGIIDVRGVWETSEVTPFEWRLEWSAACPDSDLNVSASLCWKHHQHLCVPVSHSALEKANGPPLAFNTSAVDRHPHMCIQFSVQGSHDIYCPFKDDKPSWKVNIAPGRQSLFVYINSSATAKYSTQLCVLSERGCRPLGTLHSARMEGSGIEMRLNVPPHFLTEKPCVLVWQSDPALQGRRILCLDYVHYRGGLYAVAALIFVAGATLLGLFIRNVAKSGAAGWLCFQRPLLLVCSSERSAHVSAVCALASVLQEDLGATVHTSLWAQSSQTESGPGVADVGPLPWLYGQWEAVCNAQGKVFIIWSPEAKTKYEKWREERKRENLRKAGVKIGEEEFKQNGKRVGKSKKERAQKECVKVCDQVERCPQKESSTVIEPVFMAALACLDGTQHKCKRQGAAIVYFQGLGHRRDIPKSLRGVPRFCLPQDLRGLIQELGGVTRQTKSGAFRWHCWPRLLSKVLSTWLARRLAQRLQTLLPRAQEGTSSGKLTSDKTPKRFRLPQAAMPETEQEQEPLRPGSPWRTQDLTLQTFVVLET